MVLQLYFVFADHFYEQDTIMHAWESLAKILATDLTDGTFEMKVQQ